MLEGFKGDFGVFAGRHRRFAHRQAPIAQEAGEIETGFDTHVLITELSWAMRTNLCPSSRHSLFLMINSLLET